MKRRVSATGLCVSVAFLAALVCLGLPACQVPARPSHGPASSPGITIREVVLATLPPAAHYLVDVSPDGRRVAYTVYTNPDSDTDTGCYAVVDGVAGKPYDGCVGEAHHGHPVFQFIFSPDSRRIAYPARRGNKWLFVVDGDEGKEYDGVWLGQFSPDSRHFAYVAPLGGKMCCVLDGVEGKAYDNVEHLRFSPDSERVVYVARCGRVVRIDGNKADSSRAICPGRRVYSQTAPPSFFGHDSFTGEPGEDDSAPDDGRGEWNRFFEGKAQLVVNGVECREYDDVGWPVFSPNSKRLACWAWRKQGWAEGKGWVLVVDGVEGQGCERPELPVWGSLDGAFFSPDSARVAYRAGCGAKEFFVVDSVAGKGYDRVSDRPIFSPDSRRVAYWARRGGNTIIVVDGVESRPYDERLSHYSASPIIFSPDSKHVAFEVWRDGQHVVVLDGKEYPDACWPEFSPDSRRFAYATAMVTPKADPPLADLPWELLRPFPVPTRVVVDGTRSRKHPSVSPPFFSPDSRRLAYTVGDDGADAFVVDGIQGKAYYQFECFTFSPDSKHFAYWAWDGDKWRIVADGAESDLYDSPLEADLWNSWLAYQTPNVLWGLAVRGRQVLRIEIRWDDT